MKIVDAKVEGASLLLTVKIPRLDAAKARDFKKECEEIWRPGIDSVTADLGMLEFIDSSGIGAFLSLYKKLPPSNPSVKLRRVQPAVQSVIELLRLHRIFEIEA
ncbi:MAG: STAS domain-containing protein [Verrucomicrobiota bacterium]